MQDAIIVETATELADCAVELIRETIAGAVKQREMARVALSGGETPRETYRRLARAGLDLAQTHWFWVDERCVPPHSPRSNYGRALDDLIQPAGITPRQVFRMEGELDQPESAAERYETVLKREFSLADGPPNNAIANERIRFDLVIAGIGLDGHTGSLFPGTGSVREGQKLVLATHPGGHREDRVTLTRPLLVGARRVIILVQGESKRDILRAARTMGSEDEVPARMFLSAAPGTVTWLVDRAAAGE